MILNNEQVKLIADRGRALPDAVLAPLVLSLVLGTAAAPAPSRQPTASQSRPVQPTRLDRMHAVARFVAQHPGVAMAAIYAHLDCSRSSAKLSVADAVRGGLISRRGEKRNAQYFPSVELLPPPGPTPAVLLTEQRFDGANHQKLVRVERRRGVRKAIPSEAQRKAIVVDYIRQHPGAQMGEIAKHLECSTETARRAVQAARQDGRVRMEGTLGRARYFARTIVNGGNIENIDAAFRPRAVANGVGA